MSVETRPAQAPAAAPWREHPPFPAVEPPSHTDAAAIAAYEWAAFGGLAGLGDTRRVSEPEVAFSAYHWAVTLHGEYALAGLVGRVQAELAASAAAPALTLVDRERVCVPLLRVADAGDLDAAVLADLEWAGRQACAERTPLRLVLGPATAAPGSVRLTVAPWDGLLAIHHGLRAATRRVLGPRPWLRELTPYRPHVSVAHVRADLPAATLAPVLERLRVLAPVRLRVRRVSLVRVTRLGPATEWHDAASVPIGPVRSF